MFDPNAGLDIEFTDRKHNYYYWPPRPDDWEATLQVVLRDNAGQILGEVSGPLSRMRLSEAGKKRNASISKSQSFAEWPALESGASYTMEVSYDPGKAPLQLRAHIAIRAGGSK